MAGKDLKAHVDWLKGLTFVGHASSQHGVIIDGSDEGKLGSSPMELLLMGAGGCASIDIVLILEKGRQNVTHCEVDLTGRRRDEQPRTFTHIHMHFKVTGCGLNEDKVARAVELSMTKYCSASLTLKKACEITWDHEVVEMDVS